MSQSDRVRAHMPFELQMLAALPCGCIAADYRATLLDVDLIALEAKGPHCTLPGHADGLVLGLGDCLDIDLVEFLRQPAA
jgi:hypothetical protein